MAPDTKSAEPLVGSKVAREDQEVDASKQPDTTTAPGVPNPQPGGPEPRTKTPPSSGTDTTKR